MRTAALLAFAFAFAVALGACTAYSAAPESSADGGATTDADGGVVPGSDAGGAGTDAGGIGCMGNPDCERIVFVTSTTTKGSIGGLEAADRYCQNLADGSALTKGRAFRAWLSTTSTTAFGRIAHGTKPYKRPDGTRVSKDFPTMMVQAFEAPINVDEKGMVVPTGEVWTGTSDIGVQAGPSCSNWTSDATGVSGRQGSAGRQDSPWSDTQFDVPCSESARVYCFEN